MNKITCENFINFSKTAPLILRKARLAEKIKNRKKILIKPNLTINLMPPTTTPAALTEEVIKFCRANSQAEIVIAEGSGGCDTQIAFQELDYQKLAKKYNIELVDLNRSRRVLKINPRALALKKVKLPEILFADYFIINLPVLKEHGAATVTCAMKNWFGAYLNKFMRSHSWWRWWSKSELHFRYGIYKSIIDLNNYIKTDFSLVDASIGQTGDEINGAVCNPPIKKLIAGYDIKELDRFCCQFLNRDWREIKYLK